MLVSQSRKLTTLDKKTMLGTMANKTVIRNKSNIWQNVRQQLQVAVNINESYGA